MEKLTLNELRSLIKELILEFGINDHIGQDYQTVTAKRFGNTAERIAFKVWRLFNYGYLTPIDDVPTKPLYSFKVKDKIILFDVDNKTLYYREEDLSDLETILWKQLHKSL